jgi:drug/metabolite transporter (DMT)-like permease
MDGDDTRLTVRTKRSLDAVPRQSALGRAAWISLGSARAHKALKRPSGIGEYAIWGFAFGYFACYVPYSALTKALSDGLLRGMSRGISGFELLPSTAMASLIGMFLFLTAMRWWKFAGHRELFGRRVPMPGIWTFLSGLCTAAIIATTTLAYTFSGVSIVFMMLLMRGGVLVTAPLVDFVSRRKVRWYSWIALALSLGALLVAFFGKTQSSLSMTVVAAIDVAVYLTSYFIRLRFMSRLAKSDDPNATKRFFVEEQMTATPAVVAVLAVIALVGHGDMMGDIRNGFTSFWLGDRVPEAIVIGLFSQGTGIFGGLILLDKRENSFCVPVNRASSILAGVCASYALYLFMGTRAPGAIEIAGAGLVVLAIVVLSLPSLLSKRAPATIIAATNADPKLLEPEPHAASGTRRTGSD